MRKNDAVSPVVGVMLMLTVTIIIAAVVSATAGGYASTSGDAPSAVMDVRIYSANSSGFSTPGMVISHISGDVLATKNLMIVTYYTVPGTGSIIRGNLTGQHSVAIPPSSGSEYGVLYINDGNRFRDPGTNRSAWFGNYSATLLAGDVLTTPAAFCTAESGNPAMEYLFPGLTFSKENFPPGAVVSVKIVHTSTGQILYNKDVVII
ncbi:MAG: type IV pilin N-terminal domain-containing protein [Methanoregulaceae archaeon]